MADELTGRASTPIELAAGRADARRRLVRRLRRVAAGAHLILALAIGAGVLAQVYLIGAYIFGAGPGALDAHRSLGFGVHGLELLTLLVALIAWLPRADRWLSLALAAIGTVQIALAGAHAWTGGLHPLGAMVVLGLAAVLAQRGMRRRRSFQSQPR
jgi:hypothetical protein